jgi:hypothetical protein
MGADGPHWRTTSYVPVKFSMVVTCTSSNSLVEGQWMVTLYVIVRFVELATRDTVMLLQVGTMSACKKTIILF